MGVALAALVALLAILLRPVEPKWRVSVEASKAEAAPWSTIRLRASIDPPGAVEKPEKWKWTWRADGAEFSHDPMTADWKSDVLGVHDVFVDVVSPWGTLKSASVTVTILYPELNSPVGKMLNPAALVDKAQKELPYGIADVWVEKDHVCQGEPSRIRVTPFDKRGEKQWLTASINGQAGWEVPFVVPLMPPGLQAVPITVSDPRVKGGLVNDYAFVDVEDCVAPFPIFLSHAVLPPEEENIAFRVTMFDGPAWKAWNTDGSGNRPPKSKAASYHWTFGDGAEQTTNVPDVEHRYASEIDRPDERGSFYPAKVEAFDATGKSMGVAYDGVLLANPLHALRKDHGVIQLITRQSPETQDPEGSRVLDFTLMNIDASEAARLTAMSLELVPCDGKDPTPRSGSLSNVLSDTLVAPRHGTVSGRLKIPEADLEGDFCWVRGALSGTSEPGGLKVTGTFSMATSRAAPTPTDLSDEDGLALERQQGPELTDALATAIHLLGHKQAHNPEALRRLEDEGKIPRGLLTRDAFGSAH